MRRSGCQTRVVGCSRLWRSRPEAGSNRVNRGGSWNNTARNCRASNRNRNDPGNRNDNLGFRPLSSRRGDRDERPPHGPMDGVHGFRPRAQAWTRPAPRPRNGAEEGGEGGGS